MSRPLVLLSNDDGVHAEGLRTMLAALAERVDVVVCAPSQNQSASSHSLSLSRILRLKEHGGGIFSVDGTPADCVYVALQGIGRVLPRPPDLCVSGINHGVNLGVDVFYSGTVAAAREAAIRGVPAIAFSAHRDVAFADAAAAAMRIVDALLARTPATRHAHGTGPLLNVNFPPGRSWSVVATRLGRRVYDSDVVYRVDPRGAEYLWIGGSDAVHHDAPGSDTEAFDAGHASLTPLSLDLFDASRMDDARAVAAETRGGGVTAGEGRGA